MSEPGRMQFVTSGNVRLATRQWGERGRPTVLLVHGYPDSSHVWEAVAARLADTLHVVAHDVRGAGASTAPRRASDYRLEHLVADIGAIADAFSPDRPVHLVGHDWGSIQSWEAITTEPMRGRVASYTSVSGPCLDHVGHWIRQRLEAGERADRARVAAQLIRSWYIALFQLPVLAPAAWNLGLDRHWPKLLGKLESVSAPDDPAQRRNGRYGVNLYRANVLERLRKPRERSTEVPVQLLVPLRDRFVTPQLFDDLTRWAPKLWRLDIDAGHWLPLSHPQTVADRIRRFIHFIGTGVESAELRRERSGNPHPSLR